MFNIDNKISYDDFFNYAKEVYDSLEDNQSKKIFEKRLIFNVTQKSNDLYKLFEYASEKVVRGLQDIYDFSNWTISQDEILICYGAGKMAVPILDIIKAEKNKTDNIIFCDTNADNIESLRGYPVITKDELLAKYKTNKVIITTNNYCDEVYDFLIENGFNKADIAKGLYIGNPDIQYFDEMIKLSDEEIFVDAGVLNGNTSVCFAEKTNYKYKHIYLFEPDNQSYKEIHDNEDFKALENTTLFNKGLWDKKDTLRFKQYEQSPGSNHIDNDGNISIEVDSLDSCLGDTPVTFIKMDVEGAELNALKGAENIIRKYKPKLAISLYHKKSDIIDIPLYIKSIVPEYKLYIRHYTSTQFETVLYAVL